MVAVINNFGGFYQTWLYVHEAKRCGAMIHVPDVNYSHYTTAITGNDVYLGFVHLQNLESKVAQHILTERQQNGHFISLQDFVSRMQIGKEQLILLIRIGAFSFTGKTKPQLLWEMHSLLNKEVAPTPTPKLFAPEQRTYQLPDLQQSQLEDAYDEIELLGFPVSNSWFDLLETSFRGAIPASDFINHVGKKMRMLGQLVTIKYVRTIKNETMNFGTFIDVEGNFFDTTHFPPSLKEYPFKGTGLYLILGKIVEEFGYATIEVEKMAKMPIKPDPRAR
jgi:DNA polymerase III alpha subunit